MRKVILTYLAVSILVAIEGGFETLVDRPDLLRPPLEDVVLVLLGPLGWLWGWGLSRFMLWQVLAVYLAATLALDLMVRRLWARHRIVAALGGIVIWLVSGAAFLLLTMS